MSRINTGTMTVGIFAILFGLVGAYALRAALVRPEAPPPVRPITVSVPLASIDLPAGRELVMGDMVLVPMTREEMEERKYPLNNLMIQTDQIVGRILSEPLKEGDAFLTTRLYPQGMRPSVADRLKPGYRAVTIAVNDLSAVGGEAVAGTYVDVLFRANAEPADDATNKPAIPETTVTLLQGVEVIDVSRNQETSRQPGDMVDVRMSNRPTSNSSIRAVTLAVSPEQANALNAVMGKGNLTLALRGDPATGNSPDKRLSLPDLLGIEPPTKPFVTEIYRGTARQNLEFDDDKVVNETFGGMRNPPPAPRTPVPPIPSTTPPDDDNVTN